MRCPHPLHGCELASFFSLAGFAALALASWSPSTLSFAAGTDSSLSPFFTVCESTPSTSGWGGATPRLAASPAGNSLPSLSRMRVRVS